MEVIERCAASLFSCAACLFSWKRLVAYSLNCVTDVSLALLMDSAARSTARLFEAAASRISLNAQLGVPRTVRWRRIVERSCATSFSWFVVAFLRVGEGGATKSL